MLSLLKEGNTDLVTAIQNVSMQTKEMYDNHVRMQEELKQLKEDRENDRRTIRALEDHIKKNNLIIKGIPSEVSAIEAAGKVISQSLKVVNPIQIRSSRKIFDRNGTMGVVIELDGEAQVQEVLKHTKNLAGTKISVEKDLNSDRQEYKKVMLQLRRDILGIDKSKKVLVRDDRMRIENKTFHWNWRKELSCGKMNGVNELKNIYDNILDGLDFSYNSLLSKIRNY